MWYYWEFQVDVNGECVFKKKEHVTCMGKQSAPQFREVREEIGIWIEKFHEIDTFTKENSLDPKNVDFGSALHRVRRTTYDVHSFIYCSAYEEAPKENRRRRRKKQKTPNPFFSLNEVHANFGHSATFISPDMVKCSRTASRNVKYGWNTAFIIKSSQMLNTVVKIGILMNNSHWPIGVSKLLSFLSSPCHIIFFLLLSTTTRCMKTDYKYINHEIIYDIQKVKVKSNFVLIIYTISSAFSGYVQKSSSEYIKMGTNLHPYFQISMQHAIFSRPATTMHLSAWFKKV